MASNDNWIKRVLFKLNELFLDGSDFDDRRWRFDWDEKLSVTKNLENVELEDGALETLTQAEVIKSHVVENRYRSDQIDYWDLHGKEKLLHVNWYQEYDADPALREYDYMRGLDGFNHNNFQRFCELYSFNPSSDSVIATLELLSGVTPVIKIGEVGYRMQTLGDGTITQQIASYAAKNFDKELSLSELQQAISARQLTNKGVNISQLFRKNIFSPHKTLSKFAVISPKSFMLKQQVLLTPSEVEKIRKTSTH